MGGLLKMTHKKTPKGHLTTYQGKTRIGSWDEIWHFQEKFPTLHFQALLKGQLISKAKSQAVDSPKNERTAFDFTL